MVVYVYHSARFFDLVDWHVKNVDTYFWVNLWNVFVSRWMMPLFFIISGASLYYAVEKPGGWAKFYVGKFLRLMIPVIIGSMTHGALMIYLERRSHGQFSGSFLSFLPEYFNGVYLGIGMAGNFAFHGMHLWYLLFLFIYSLICYRLFIWLKRNGKRILNRVVAFLAIPGWMYLGFTLPLLLMKAIIPAAVFNVGNGGWGFLTYFWFLVSGFIIVSSDRLQQLIKRQRHVSLIFGVLIVTGYLFQGFGSSPLAMASGINNWLVALLSFLSAWCWLLTILGYGMNYLASDHPVLASANDAVMPFYILHQTVLLSIGYFVMQWELPDTLKWIFVFTASLLILAVLVAFMIRKLDLLRFLFGMKTTHSFFHLFKRKSVLIILHALYMGLIVFAVIQGVNSRSAMPMRYDATTDILLDAHSVTGRSPAGVRVVKDKTASIGQAIEFIAGANQRSQAHPEVYLEMQFTAAAGKYFIWLRGKTDQNDGYTDSVWVQVDDQIGSEDKSVRMGNWLDVHPPGVYGWAGDTDEPIGIILNHSGEHTIRIQPRQVPHRLDQVWFSRMQERIPDTNNPIDNKIPSIQE